ncbi:ABC-type transport system involved in multi-copper enzyme maturation permease subunit [Nocardioides thalensis]|uniref:ABC-type transport system involved in multi-copper enzyme maturation permease subunit n=1 Tax=Nocardioides thalensis TaxID=1914755 RepID=A0A853C1S0_9ACTN|nr:ABC transporter permease [Nocardioides thalensis]NYJ00662.1 ABC-type transport system involved in multi-copper enzyme maturation permease subunit [Nocardioides thalensis]
MSTTTIPATASGAAVAVPKRERAVPDPIPFTRILAVELRKMFDTRAGFWLMASIVISSAIATTITVLVGDRDELSLDSFAASVGSPTSIILPLVAALAVSSEWSQRTALTSFTLVPSRRRVIGAKLVNVLALGAISMLVALGIGAIGNLVAAGITGNDPVWDIPAWNIAQIVLANELGMLVGFTLGLLFRNSPAAIVGYFVFSLVLPGLSEALASAQDWWADNAAWFDLNQTRFLLFDSELSSQDWVQLGLTTGLWVLVPFVIGLRLVMRSEVK